MVARPHRSNAEPQDGIVDLPQGKIAAIATYLEMRARPSGPAPVLPGTVERLVGDLPRYRRIYARVGEPWLWFTRALMPDAALEAIIHSPDVEVWLLRSEGRDVGMAELDFRRRGECELVFFGLVPEACGRGTGRALLGEAVRRAFLRPIERVWLHTCTLDHPSALPVYMKAGFKPYRRAIEVADDPRLGGYLPANAAPQFPIL